MISLQDIYKKVDKSFELGPLSCQIEPGSIVALVGNNGAGKSTLFQTMMELVKKESGEIDYHFGTDRENGWKQAFAYVPQTPLMYHGFTIVQLADFFEMSYPGWNRNEFDRLTSLFNLPLKKQVEKLSGGMQKKAMLSLTLARESKVLLLDEPLAGVDFEGQEQMRDEMVRYMERAEDQTILLSTHSADEIRTLADYILLMKDGHLLNQYEKDSLIASWSRIWVEGDTSVLKNLKGMVSASKQGSLVECVTSNAFEVEQELKKMGAAVTSIQPLELREILRIILKEETKSA
ncbi:ABC transporter ATP-binding protein [Alkalihalophilus pseudofirmus]|uniref:ABC transporter ATP-binding protein n=1 Tax=Alkalihalophilus pseudofirmus TaxID=79885 RepID=A0AAJ2NQQ7_ALKPS|nr:MULTISPECIES: ABC transporter ATP-binding protein [Alkalihalophilus]MDV2886879.1 ABC transporter ATP-binding protein [Alkalihalophilus pseudofirmus]MED1600612.1 ABC transporter ATP-binding protein [Alkalihalophilus marmarensis]